MTNLIKTLINNMSGVDCHKNLDACLREAKRRGFTVDREKAAQRIAGGLNARPTTR